MDVLFEIGTIIAFIFWIIYQVGRFIDLFLDGRIRRFFER